MEKKVNVEMVMTTAELRVILRDFLVAEGHIGGSDKLTCVEPVMESIETPGRDPHDCDYIEKFAGLKLVVVKG